MTRSPSFSGVRSASGHAIVARSSRTEGLAAAESSSFDLAILDIGLPDGTGLDLM